MGKFKDKTRPNKDDVSHDDNNASQEKEYRKEKREVKINDSEE